MAKAMIEKRATRSRSRPARKRAGWLRKNVVVDQRKLDSARRALGTDSDTETIDQALDLVTFRQQLVRGFAAVRRAGGIKDVFERGSKG